MSLRTTYHPHKPKGQCNYNAWPLSWGAPRARVSGPGWTTGVAPHMPQTTPTLLLLPAVSHSGRFCAVNKAIATREFSSHNMQYSAKSQKQKW